MGWPNLSRANIWGFNPRFSAVNVHTCGARGDSVSDDYRALQNAIDKAASSEGGVVYFPPGAPSYRISRTLVLPSRNLQLLGAANHRCNLVPTDDFDGDALVSIRASDCKVGGMGLRPRTGIAGVRVQGASHAHIFDSLFMATNETVGQGDAIVLDDRDENGVFKSGSYFHRIERCGITRATLAVARGIVTDAQDEINQCTIRDCAIICDEPVVWMHGGGNLFSGNLFQRFSAGQSGTAIQCALGQILDGNFIENFEESISNISVSNPHQGLETNYYDNIAEQIGSNIPSTLIVNADETLLPITRLVHRLNGNGALRSDCGLPPGTRPGQRLTLIGFSWGVRIISNGAGGAGAPIVYQTGLTADPNFTNASGGVSVMELIWDNASVVWREISRAVYP